MIREALERLAGSRVHEVVLCGVLCATRIKFFGGGGLLPTTCQQCGAADSFVHLVGCVGLEPPTPPPCPGPMIEFLTELARRAARVHAGVPVPRREGLEASGELELSLAGTSGASSSDGCPASLLADPPG